MVVVLDTNVLVSAFQFGGKPEQLIDMACAGEISVAISPSILTEFTRILRDKFGWSKPALEDATATLWGCTKRVEPTQRLNVVPDDPDDNHIIETGVASRADAIITGDKDLLRLGEYQRIKIMRVSDFLGTGGLT